MLGEVAAAVGGLILLVFAADRLVVSAARISRALGVSAVAVGALVVGLGTSLPELLVSGLAALRGELDLAMNNITGSNVANVTLVLGSAAIVTALAAMTATTRREGALMFGAVVLLAAVLWNGFVERWEGFVLLAGLGVALYSMMRWSVRDAEVAGLFPEKDDPDERPLWMESIFAVAAIVLVLVGSRLLLDGAVSLGERFGLSAAFLGLMLGVGTSLPELSTALAAARRREPDLVIGNVLGSNLFNSLAVAGVAAVLGPGPLFETPRSLLIYMVLAALVAGVFALTGQRIVRREGAVLLLGFIVFAVLAF